MDRSVTSLKWRLNRTLATKNSFDSFELHIGSDILQFIKTLLTVNQTDIQLSVTYIIRDYTVLCPAGARGLKRQTFIEEYQE